MARVLIVEDNEAVLQLLCELAQDCGHEPDGVRTKAEAITLLASGSHALVIADVRLPDGRADDIARRATELGIDLVLMGGHPEDIDNVQLVKPFSPQTFERLLERYLS